MTLGALALVALTAVRPVAARLEYVSGVASCPDEQGLRGLVAAKLGYDPFEAGSGTHVSVNIEESGDALQATVKIASADGRTAERKLNGTRGDCRELAASTAFAIAVALDPLFSSGGPRKPAPPPEPTPPAPEPPKPSTAAGIGVDAEVLVGIGQAPEVGIGGALRASLLFESFAVSLEARADVPSAITVLGGRVGGSLFIATAAGCYRWRALQACMLLSGGALRAFGDGFPDAAVRWLPYGGAGARALVRVPLGPQIYLEAHGDFVVPFVRTELTLGNTVGWSMPVVGGAIAAGLGYRLD